MSLLLTVLGFILNINKVNGYGDSEGTLNTTDTECSRLYQSPIDIEFSELADCSVNKSYPNEIYLDVSLRNKSLTNFIIENDGYSITVIPFIGNHDNPKYITEVRVIHENKESIFQFNNPLNITYEYDTNKRYCFDSLHFHWGSNSTFGSEHTFNNIPTALEAHLLGFSCDYHDVRAALHAYQSGTAKDKYVIGVIGVLFDLGEPNKALHSILNHELIDNVRIFGYKKPGIISYNYAQFNITDLIPGYSLVNKDKSLSSIAMYLGSLTTPPCYETIRWFVMKEKLTVSNEQLQQFRRILNSKNDNSSNNYRDINPLNNRTIYNCEYQIILDQRTATNTSKYSPVNVSIIFTIVCVGVGLILTVIVCWHYKGWSSSQKTGGKYSDVKHGKGHALKNNKKKIPSESSSQLSSISNNINNNVVINQ